MYGFIRDFWIDAKTYDFSVPEALHDNSVDIAQKRSHKIEETLDLVLSGLKLTGTAIDLGFTTLDFNQDFMFYLTHIFAEFISKQPYFLMHFPIGNCFSQLCRQSKTRHNLQIVYKRALQIMGKIQLITHQSVNIRIQQIFQKVHNRRVFEEIQEYEENLKKEDQSVDKNVKFSFQVLVNLGRG